MLAISYRHVTQKNAKSILPGFTSAFQEAFGGAPYFESYQPDEVRDDIWKPHLKNGLVIVACDSDQVVGFGCALPVVAASKEVCGYLTEQHASGVLPIPPDQLWYMSEVGVIESHRRNGIGTELINHRLKLITERGGSHFVMRTAAVGSNSESLYMRAGAIRLPGFQDVSASGQVTVNASQSEHRIYLYGACSRQGDLALV